MTVKAASVCSGIEAFSVAAAGLDVEAIAFAEVAPFPCFLLAERWGATRPRFLLDPEEEGIRPRDAVGRRLAARAIQRHAYWGNRVPNFGDFRRMAEDPIIADVDLLAGGTPCQAFSMAGLRQSLRDHRGNLTLEYVKLADAIDAARARLGRDGCKLLWEQVPGVLNTDDNAFGCFLGALVGEDAPLTPRGGKWTHAGLVIGPRRTVAWRVLNTEFFGLPQRRERVFLVGGPGEFGAGAVLFEPHGVRRHPGARRKARQATPTVPPPGVGGGGPAPIAFSRTDYGQDAGAVSPTLRAMEGHHANAGGQVAVAIPIQASSSAVGQNGAGVGLEGDPMFTLDGGPMHAVAFSMRGRDGENMIEPEEGDVAPALRGGDGGSSKPFVATVDLAQITTRENRSTVDPAAPASTLSAESKLYAITRTAVRRLTERECERLQGYEDDYTLLSIKFRGDPAKAPLDVWDYYRAAGYQDDRLANAVLHPAGPRYKAIGLSWSVPVVRWILVRLLALHAGEADECI